MDALLEGPNKFTIIHVHILLASQVSCIISDVLTGEEGSYDASEERERQIMRDHLRANAVRVLMFYSHFHISTNGTG